jgi:hypothetical protein
MTNLCIAAVGLVGGGLAGWMLDTMPVLSVGYVAVTVAAQMAVGLMGREAS